MYKFKQIFAIFLSVLLLSLTVGDAFISTNDISHVQATGAEVAAGAAAADAIWELVIALLSAVGLGGAAVANKDAVMESFTDYISAPGKAGEIINENVINLYDSAVDSIKSIPIDEFMDSLQNYHDSAVDTLTGIYAQYCPELIGITKDFVADVAAKNITIAGVTDAFSTPMTADVVAQQWSGEMFDYSAYCYSSGIWGDFGRYIMVDDLSITADFPIACIHHFQVLDETPSAMREVFGFYYINKKGNLAPIEFSDTYKYDRGIIGILSSTKTVSSVFCTIGENYYTDVTMTCNANFPMFSSLIEAEAYLKGTGAVTDALNYSTDITDTITDNNDLPTIGGFADELWERVARAPDCGIGAYGSGALVGDWADDIPWLGLGDLDDFVNSIQDVFDKTIAGILDGTYDLPLDIPDYTYGDAWIDAIDRTWDDVIDNPVNDPAIDKPDNPDKPAIGDKDDPITGDKDTTIPIDIPADDLVPTMNDSLSDIAGNLKYKFPFSIPWDIRHVFQVLADTPKAPRFELPLVIKRFDIDERIIVDMAMFQVLSNLSRSLFSMLFGMYLMNLTFKVVAMRKEE